MALITVDQYKVFVGTPLSDTRDNAMLTVQLDAASAAINNFTERDFGTSQVTEARLFEYDGSGYMDIDDASVVTAVTLTFPDLVGVADLALDAYQFEPGPFRTARTPIYTYIRMTPGFYGFSPEMGFKRNLDVLYNEGRFGTPSDAVIRVNGTFGWPAVPADVQQALVWTIQEWNSRPHGEGLQSESIESYSRSWGRAGGLSGALALPNRARDILVNYQRIAV